MTATCVQEGKTELYEQLRLRGRIADGVPSVLRREVYLMAWRVMPSSVKEQLCQARAAFHPEQHECLEREALRGLPPFHEIVNLTVAN
ncbi:MAG: hypothetical protein NZT92_06835 [Abditibacteriales bacterium]|nr:hypothetical protein [Abditibacteriales bacterium]MDW8365497.1 hypothetical protein [Abditibacteriales bacterium]